MVTPARRRSTLMFVVVALAIAAAVATRYNAVLRKADDSVTEPVRAVRAADVRAGLVEAKARANVLAERFEVYMDGIDWAKVKQGNEDFDKVVSDLMAAPDLIDRLEFHVLLKVGYELHQGRTKSAAAALEEAQKMLGELEARLDRFDMRD